MGEMGKQSCMYDYQADDEQGEGIWGGGRTDEGSVFSDRMTP